MFVQFVKEGHTAPLAIMPEKYVRQYVIPAQETYGEAIQKFAQSLSKNAWGFWVVEQDIALSFEAMQELKWALGCQHFSGYTIAAGNYRLYTPTTGRNEIVAAHRLAPRVFSGYVDRGEWKAAWAVSLGCTWLPLDFIRDFVSNEWDYPGIDATMSAVAREAHVPMYVYQPRNPIIHLHY